MTGVPAGVVADELEIRALVARYNRAADDGDVDAYVGTFAPDGTFDVVDGPTARGHEAIRSLIAAAPFGSVHATADSIVEVDGDRATHTCTLLLCCRRRDRQVVRFVTTGRYDDDLVRTGSGWRFARRRASTDLALGVVNRRFRDVSA